MRTVVPRLIGASRSGAESRLAAAGLLLGRVGGDDAGVVADQSPPPGKGVERGSRVDVSLRPVLPRLVVVPDVVGLTAERAGAALTDAGLRLAAVPAADLDRKVAAQRPARGNRLARGGTVRVVLTPVPPAPFPWSRVLGGLVGVAALTGAGLVGGHLARVHRDERWVREHLRVRRRPLVPPGATVESHDRTAASDVVVRVQGRRDTGTTVLEEDRS
jgi:hypothetical protein